MYINFHSEKELFNAKRLSELYNKQKWFSNFFFISSAKASPLFNKILSEAQILKLMKAKLIRKNNVEVRDPKI